MRFYEKCGIVDPFKNFDDIIKYIIKLFNLSHTTAVFISIEPSVIATRVEGVLRRIAIAPGYAILCSHEAFSEFNTIYILAEPSWIESDILIPYSSNEPCNNKLSRYGITIEVNEELGVLHLCTKDVNEKHIYKILTTGGLIEVSDGTYSGVGTLKIVPLKDKFFFIAKGLGLKTLYNNIEYSLAKTFLDPRLEALSNRLVVVNNNDALIAIGRGYLKTFNLLTPIGDYIYLLLLITSYTIPRNEPKAKYYINKQGFAL
jgi:hypothetical protein